MAGGGRIAGGSIVATMLLVGCTIPDDDGEQRVAAHREAIIGGEVAADPDFLAVACVVTDPDPLGGDLACSSATVVTPNVILTTFHVGVTSGRTLQFGVEALLPECQLLWCVARRDHLATADDRLGTG